MTQRLGNRGPTEGDGRAAEELRYGETISAGSRETIEIGAGIQTTKVGGPHETPQNVPS